jgi:hypothetical protein
MEAWAGAKAPIAWGALMAAAALGFGAAEAAQVPTFITRTTAETYLARALPEATAANAKYKDPNSDIETSWLTRSISFKKDHQGGILVSMHEDILKYRGEKVVGRGTHSAEFPIEVTGVGLISDAWLPVDSVEAAAGILFKCPKEPCIRSTHDGKLSMDRQTDITIDDHDTRANLYAAFRALLKESGLR